MEQRRGDARINPYAVAAGVASIASFIGQIVLPALYKDPPQWLLHLLLVSAIILLVTAVVIVVATYLRERRGEDAGTLLPLGAERIYPTVTAPKAVSAASLKDTQFLLNSAIEPAHRAITTLIRTMAQALSRHRSLAVRSLAPTAQTGATDLAEITLGKLVRAVRGIDPLDEEQLQRSVGWFWNQYRLQTHFISKNIIATKAAGGDIRSLLDQWLEADRTLRDELHNYSAPQERGTIREALRNDGWDNQIIDEIIRARNSSFPKI